MSDRSSFSCRPTALAIFLVTWIAGSGTAGAEGLVLRFAPILGTDYHFVIDQHQDVALDLGALGDQKMTNTSRIEMTLRALSRDDDGTTAVDLGVDRVVTSVAQGDTTVFALDTAKMDEAASPDAAGMAAAMRMILGAGLSISFSARGEVESVTGFESIWQKVEEAMGEDPQIEQFLGMLEQGLSDESMAQQMGIAFPVFPEGPVTEGASWNHQAVTKNPIAGEILMASTYTVGGKTTIDGRSCRELGVETTVEMKGTSGMVEQLEKMLGTELDIGFEELATSGTMCVDDATGLAIRSDMDQQMVMTLSIPHAPNTGEPMSMRMRLDGNITMDQVEVASENEERAAPPSALEP